MSGIIAGFETTAPLKFKEKGCDTEFAAKIRGAAYINSYDEAAYGATENERRANIAKLMLEKVEGHLSKWSERDERLYKDGENKLALLLNDDMKALGFDGTAGIKEVKIADEVKDLYQDQIIKPINEARQAEYQKQLEEADVPHGPLIKLSYNVNSHSMTPTGGSYTTLSVEWAKDGSVIYTDSTLAGGKNIHMEYKVIPEAAQKVRDYVVSSKLAALANMPSNAPVMFDNFTSVTITMIFDDSSLGGDASKRVTLECGPVGFSYKTIEEELSALLKECKETGELIKNQIYDGTSMMGGMMGVGMMGVGMMGGPSAGTMGGSPVGMMGGAPAAPVAPAASPSSGSQWTCACGAQNSGKFCANCGSPKPADETWTCSCGAENKGKFCANCGSPKPVDESWTCSCGTVNKSKFCSACGSIRPA